MLMLFGALIFFIFLYGLAALMEEQIRRDYIEYHESLGPLSKYYNSETGELELPKDDKNKVLLP